MATKKAAEAEVQPRPTVRDAMRSILAGARLVAGADGLDRPIERVRLMETPAILPRAGRPPGERRLGRGRELPPSGPRRRKRGPAPQRDHRSPGHAPARALRPADPAHAPRGRGQTRPRQGARLPPPRHVA